MQFLLLNSLLFKNRFRQQCLHMYVYLCHTQRQQQSYIPIYSGQGFYIGFYVSLFFSVFFWPNSPRVVVIGLRLFWSALSMHVCWCCRCSVQALELQGNGIFSPFFWPFFFQLGIARNGNWNAGHYFSFITRTFNKVLAVKNTKVVNNKFFNLFLLPYLLLLVGLRLNFNQFFALI